MIAGITHDVPIEAATGVTGPMGSPTVSGDHLPLIPPAETKHRQAPAEKSPNRSSKFVRPQNLKELE